MMLAAIEAMAEADAIGIARRDDADVAAQAPSGDLRWILLVNPCLSRGGADRFVRLARIDVIA